MINQLSLPYIHMKEMPRLTEVIQTCYNENITAEYIKRLQTIALKHKLDNSYSTDFVNVLIREINNIVIDAIGFSFFEYVELIHSTYHKKFIDSCVNIGIFGGNTSNIVTAVNNIFHHTNTTATIETYTIDLNSHYKEYTIRQPSANQDVVFFDIHNMTDNTSVYTEAELCIFHIPVILHNLKQGGDMIISIEDTYSVAFTDILFYLNTLFTKVNISRPSIMKMSDTHRYLICKNLTRYVSSIEISSMCDYIYSNTIAKGLTNVIKAETRLFKQDIPMFFRHRLDEINCIYGQQILEYTMMIINNKPHEIFTSTRSRYEQVKDWILAYGEFIPTQLDNTLLKCTIVELLSEMKDQLTTKDADES